MASQIIYSLSGDFSSGIGIGQFQNEILDETGITITLLGVTVDGDDVIVTFTVVVPGAQQLILDDVVANHIPISSSNSAQATGGLVTLLHINRDSTPIGISYTEIAKIPCNINRYINFINGTVVFVSTIIDTALDIQLWDVVNTTELGVHNSSSSENSTFGVITPISDTEISIRIKNSSIGGTSPILNSLSLEYTN